MTEDEIDRLHGEYRRARKDFCVKEEIVERMGRNLKSIGRYLDPEPYSPGSRTNRTPLNPRSRTEIGEMPSASEITTAMDNWQEAKATLLAAWNAIPDAEKKHCQDLPRDARGY